MVTDQGLKDLLKVAETHIVALHADCEEYAEMMGEMVDAQAAQDLQLAELSAQIESLESIIRGTDEHMTESSMLMSALVGGIGKLRAQVQETLKAAEDNVSQMDLRDRVKAIAAVAEMADEDEMVAEYNRQIASLRDKLLPG